MRSCGAGTGVDVPDVDEGVLGVVGISGSGKSATVAALFHRERAWRRPAEPPPGAAVLRSARPSRVVRLRVVDAVDMGQDTVRDAEHLAMYERALPACHAIVWVLAARNRALALDRGYLARLAPFADRMVFGLNQVDLVEPRDWDTRRNVPSERQATRIADIAEHRRGVLGEVLGRNVLVWPYSARTGYGSAELLAAILRRCPDNRRELLCRLRCTAVTPEPVHRDEEIR